MRRRDFIAGLGGAVAWPLTTPAQQPKTPVVWFLDILPVWAPEMDEWLRRGLAEIGFSDRDVTFEYRVVEFGHGENLPAVIDDLIRRRAAAIVTINAVVASALKAATRDIPIIVGAGSDPVELGLVASLNRPGGNLTGVINPTTEIAEKRLQLLHDAVPAAETIALLVGSAGPPVSFTQIETRHMQSAARTLGLRSLAFNVTRDTDLASVFATLVEHQAGAVLVSGGLEVTLRSNEILSHAARFALPTMFFFGYSARAGGLLSYGPDLRDTWRQIGAQTGRILKGEKPGDLPFIQTNKFRLVINLKTAKALGLTIPTNLLVRADEVIEE
jgi:putative tryptophan/tyrosine transport system substrate-binding protein